MAFARYVEFEPSDDRGTPNYDRIQEQIGIDREGPAGLIIHSAGFSDDGIFRIYEVWESAEQADEFFNERVMPAVQGLGGEARDPRVQTGYELHNVIRG